MRSQLGVSLTCLYFVGENANVLRQLFVFFFVWLSSEDFLAGFTGLTKGLSLISLCYSFNFIFEHDYSFNLDAFCKWKKGHHCGTCVFYQQPSHFLLLQRAAAALFTCMLDVTSGKAVVHPKVIREQTSLICSHKSPRGTPVLVISNRPPFSFPDLAFGFESRPCLFGSPNLTTLATSF